MKRAVLLLACAVCFMLFSACGNGTSPGSTPVTPVAAPAGLSYSTDPAVYVVNKAISANTPISTGGAISSYSVSPALPAGLSLNTTTGVISGAPTAVTAQAVYTITASNVTGSTTAALTITVNPAAPAGLSYLTNPAVYAVNKAITANSPSSTGGAISSYSVSPALPAGLSLDTNTGVISGTPTAVTPQAIYTITASNVTGSTTAVLSISVTAVAVNPGGLSYSTNPAVYVANKAITANTPSSNGGAISSYSVSPALPAGLSLDTTTGVILGTPTAVTAQAVYTITATNSVGSTSIDLSITISAAVSKPSGLAYTMDSAVYAVNSVITPNIPTSSGGAADTYSITPALPDGLNFNAATGVISGAPTAPFDSKLFTITATNAAGHTSTAVQLSAGYSIAPPSALSYQINPATLTVGGKMTPLAPRHAGGAAESYSVSPALPNGLSLDTTTGVISGAPTAASVQAVYTVTATNSAGSADTSFSLSVDSSLSAPTNFVYSTNPAIYTVGTAFQPDMPTYSGGAVTSYSVSPALPNGVTLNTLQGAITGMPESTLADTNYTITAANDTGSTSAVLTIRVLAAPSAPASLSYSTNPAVYVVNKAIVANTPISKSGAVSSYSVSPALPAGLSLDTITGVISGTPSAVAAQTVYTITATNSVGSTTAALTITVNPAAPAGLSYSTNPAVYVANKAITANSPISTGGAISSYSVSPTLPAGLSLDTNTGVISGTPTTVTAQAVYTVTASNVTGSTTAALTITVNPALAAPAGLTYDTNNASYLVGNSAENDPHSTGGAISSYSVSPALPAGLSLNSKTGVISGVPTAASAQAVYTVTASNTTGSTTVALTITVYEQAPEISSFTADNAYFAIGSSVKLSADFSHGSGIVTPGNISISSGSSIYVSPTTTTTYTLTVTNKGGVSTSSTVTVKAGLDGTYAYKTYDLYPIDAKFIFFSTGVGTYAWSRKFPTSYDSWVGKFTYTITGNQIDLFWQNGPRQGTHSSVAIQDANNVYFESYTYRK